MLDAFQWDRRFETGIASVDAQHQHLVDMLNTLIATLTDRPDVPEQEIEALLGGLETYTHEHFSDEERLMEEAGCEPRHRDAHIRQHALFAEQVRLAKGEYEASGRSREVLELLARFITSWLSFHILGADQAMAAEIARLRGEPPNGGGHGGAQDVAASRILVEAMGRLYEVMAERNQSLQAARDALAELNAHLEQRVSERTAELQQALAEVERTREQLLQSEKMSAIGQLAAGVAHEINNPVGFVSSNLGSLKLYVGRLFQLIDGYEQGCETWPVPAELRAHLQRLRQEADLDYLRGDVGDLLAESAEGLDRVKKIVQDMKVFSHVDQAEWQQADVAGILETTLNVVWHELKYKAEVVRDYADTPPVHCLPSQLGQVLMNMLVNAAQAIEQPPGRILLQTRQNGDWIEVAVEDNGKGMSQDVAHRVFEPFFTTKPVGKGTGLGLSISYEIVKRHGGHILVDSSPGRGTRFTVRLPVGGPEG